MKKIKKISDNEMTVIYDPNPDHEGYNYGLIISGDRMVYRLDKSRDESLQDELKRHQDGSEHKSFLYTMPDGEQVIAHTDFTTSEVPVAVPLDKIIQETETGEAGCGQDFSPGLIREIKQYVKDYRRGARDEDIKEIRPDAGPGGSIEGKGA